MAVFEVVFDGEGRVTRVEERPTGSPLEQIKELKSVKDVVSFVRSKGPQGFMSDDLLILGLIQDVDSNPALTKDQKNALVLKLTEKTVFDQLVLRTDSGAVTFDALFANKVIGAGLLKASYKLLDYFIDP